MYRVLRVAGQNVWGCEYRKCMRDCVPTCPPAHLPYLLPTHTHPDYLPYLPSWTSPKF